MKHPHPTFVTDFRVFSIEQCKQIHLASLDILSRIGIRIFDDSALELLKSSRTDVSDGNLVRFPASLVEWALRTAPPNVTLWNRDRQPSVYLQERNVHFGSGSDCPFIRDSFTDKRRGFLKEDVAQGIRICDYLPNLDFVLSIGLVSDVDVSVSDLHQFDAMIRNTRKPVVFTAHHVRNCKVIVEMAEILAGGPAELRRRPQIALFTETISPLKYAEETTQKLLYMAEKQLPVVLSSGPMMGASGPQTHAGIIALANAEVLAGIVMAQLKCKGAPIIYALGIHPLDMHTTVLPYGAPELHLNTAAAADLARYYDLPVWGYAGCSDAKIVDQQAAIEASSSILMSLLSGNQLVHDVGYLESGMTGSFEMLVLSDTIIEMGRNLLKPIEINPETLALDVIEKVGPGGHFMNEENTLKHYREVWYHDLIDRNRYEKWLNTGGMPMGERLNRKVKKILENHKVKPFPSDIDRLLVERLAQAEEASAAKPTIRTTVEEH
jgi:trimethylamine--corrinoid protein Co-methyltransferase